MRSTSSLMASVRIATASSTALASFGTAVTSLVAVPLLQVLLLTIIAASFGSPEVVTTAYAGTLMTLGGTIAIGTASQVARDRLSGVLPEILLHRPLSCAYWAGKVVTPTFTGLVVSVAASSAVFGLDPRHAPAALLATYAVIPVVALAGAIIGVAVGLASIVTRDVFFVPNALAAVLPLTSGVVAPLETYPRGLEVVCRLIPFSNAIDAFRAAGAGDGVDLGLVALEAAVCSGWLACGIALVAVAIRRVRAGESTHVAW